MSIWTTGIFDNGMAWSSIGDGDKVAIYIPGGPGNAIPPTGWRGDSMMKPFEDLLEQNYRIVSVARKQNMPKGHTVEDMARDYAELIEAEFNGRADLMLGMSTGGMIGQYIAANHPETFKHFVAIVAGYQLNPESGPIDYAYAKALSGGKAFKAGMAIAPALFPNWKISILAQIVNGMMTSIVGVGRPHQYFAKDVMVEVEAEPGFDSRGVLPKIAVPFLIIAGDQDFYFSERVARETHSLIPNSRLCMYKGKGHIGAAMDKRIASDILEFIAAHP